MSVLENASNTSVDRSNFTHIQGNLNQTTYTVNYSTDLDEHKSITEWLTPLNFKVSQRDVFEQRTEGTGQWLLDSHEFQTWLGGESRTLWCSGMPGGGKTVLSSVVVNYLQTITQGSDTLIACIYCNYKEQETQTVPGFIASLLKQVIQDQPQISDGVKSFYEHHKRQGTRPTLQELMRVIQSEIVKYSRVFIVIDALDECLDRDRAYLITQLQALADTISLMVTSRPHAIESLGFFHSSEGAPHLDICANHDDVRRYIAGRLSRDGQLEVLVRGNSALQETIMDKILAKAGGMFLLVKLHMDSLATKHTRREVRNALDLLPAELNTTYEEVMERIAGKSESAELAKRVLAWITCTFRPLNIDELQHALAVSPEQTHMDSEAIVDKQILTSVCAGLIVVDENSNIVRLVHYTAQEYFESKRQHLFPNVQANIAATCLTYLRLWDHVRVDIFYLNVFRFSNQHALFYYAASYWAQHAREAEDMTIEAVLGFLQSRSRVERSIHASDSCEAGTLMHHDDPGILLTSFFGLAKVMHRLLNDGASVNITNTSDQSPLSIAAENGHVAAVKLLLAHHDIEVNSKDVDGWTPLWYATYKRHYEVMALFLAHQDINVNAKDNENDGRSILSFIAGKGWEAEVRLLLAHHDIKVNSRDDDGWTPLWYATHERHYEVMALFLACQDIDVNLKDNDGRSLLSYVAENGWEAEVALLLAHHDIKVNSKDNYGRTPLLFAARNMHHAVGRLFLAHHDIEVNTTDTYGRSILSFVAGNGWEAEVRLLLARHDIEVNSKDSCGRSAISYAARNGHAGVAKMLMAHPSHDVDPASVLGWTPLSFALADEPYAMRQQLINHLSGL